VGAGTGAVVGDVVLGAPVPDISQQNFPQTILNPEFTRQYAMFSSLVV